MSDHAEPWVTLDLRALARDGPVHFMGISGAGMSALAELVLRAGGQVTGCDLRAGAVGADLSRHGAVVHDGHDAAHVQDAVALVITSAITPQHPEIRAARARGIPVLKRAQALGALVNGGTVVAVAGTHGKTTTTAMAADILIEAELDPTAFVGGRVAGWGGGLRPGGDRIFAVEADEYDRSFLTLRPFVAVITSIEADHLDVYGDLAGLEATFAEFAARVPPAGIVAACTDDAGAARLTATIPATTPIVRYGTGSAATLRAEQVQQTGRAVRFTVRDEGADLGAFTIGAPGIHNVRNALGAFAATRHLGATFAAAQRALARFTGVARRFQELAQARDIVVIDDYAHHPTEVAATLQAARAMHPQRRLIAAFQPHLFTRTRDHAVAFGRALAAADVVFVTDVYPAREAPIPGITGELVVRAAHDVGADAHYAVTLPELREHLLGNLRAGDVLVCMGAGDIDEVARDVADRFHAGADR